MNLNEIAQEMREALEIRRNELGLTFVEHRHIYTMKDINGVKRTGFPSVSKILHKFHEPFDSQKKALEMSNGDTAKARLLIEEWTKKGDDSKNLGSRAHFFLETELLERHGNFKTVREPVFKCDNEQIIRCDAMIGAGKQFIDLMHERGAVLLDTEMVLGDPEEGYVGAPDTAWIIENKQKDGFGLIVTDWKSNQEKNFKAQFYNGYMFPPFNNFRDFALTHYYIQIPLYGRLLIKMLENSKFKDTKLLGGIIIHLKDNNKFDEYRVPPEINGTILQMDLKKYLV